MYPLVSREAQQFKATNIVWSVGEPILPPLDAQIFYPSLYMYTVIILWYHISSPLTFTQSTIVLVVCVT